MNPLALLRCWRQRWEILEAVPADPNAGIMIDRGDLGMSVAHMGIWSSIFMTASAALLGLLLLLIAGFMVFGIGEQVALGCLVVALAIYVRGYRGLLSLLAMGGLAILCGVRYLSWRWQYTLPGGNMHPVGVCLFLVELVVFLAFVAWLAQMAWPLNQDAVGMPDSENDWPYIDVVLVAPGPGGATVAELREALTAQQWPLARMHVFVQDAFSDPDLHAACRSLGFTYVDRQAAKTSAGRPACLDAELPHGNGEYVLVLGDDAYAELRADPLLLQSWAAWLNNDPSLGVLYTLGHPIAPSLGVNVDELPLTSGGGNLTLIRRAAWKRQGISSLHNFVQRLEATDYCSALVGHPKPDAAAPRHLTNVTWMRIDNVGDGRSVLKRQHIHLVARLLHRLLPWALGAMAIAALVIPLTGVLLIRAPFSWFAAYAIPYVAMMFLAWSDNQSINRLDIGSAVRDWLLALVLPLIVAGRAILICWHRLFGSTDNDVKVAHPVKLYARLAVGVIALVLALLRIAVTDDAVLLPWLDAVAIGISYEILLTLSRWTVGQEARSLRTTFAQQPCILISPDGKSLACRTRNFPLQPLQLEFAAPSLDLGTALNDGGLQVAGDSAFALIIGRERTSRVFGSTAQMGSRSALMYVASASQPVFLRASDRARARLLTQKYWLPGPNLGLTTLSSSEFQ